MSKIVSFAGGARSGKSTRAEQYVTRLKAPVMYVATARAGGDEMRDTRSVALPIGTR